MDKLDLIYQLLQKTDGRIDRVDELLKAQHETLVAQKASLDLHIKRTNLLEDAVKPIIKYHYMVQGAAGLLGLIALISTIIAVFQ